MQNKYFKLLIIILALAVIVPQVALAAWWNPLTWNWNIFSWFSKPPTIVQQNQNINKNQATNYFEIYPVGLKFENPKNIKDLVYFINNVSGGKQVDFSTQLLQDQYQQHYKENCGIDYNPMGAMQISQKDPSVPGTTYLVKSNNFYVTYIKPNGKCSDVTKEQIDSLLVALKSVAKSGSQTSQNVVLKTYTNNDFGLEFKYPDYFKVTVDENSRESLSLSLGYKNYVYIGDISMTVLKNTNNETAVQYFQRKKNEALQGFASKCQTCGSMDKDAEFYDCLENKSDVITIAGKEGFLCKRTPSSIFVFSGGYIYEYLGYDQSNPSYKLYSEIISTFKFTK